MLEKNKEYKTKSGQTVIIKTIWPFSFLGETPDGKMVKYDMEGKVQGWFSGHPLDIIIDTAPVEEPVKPHWADTRREEINTAELVKQAKELAQKVLDERKEAKKTPER